MANFSYDALSNDKVRFLQGTQADLNKYLPGSSDAKKGKALEGAFYLTTDTHKLYVGRKVTVAATGAAVGDVFPEEVSAGLTIVDSTSDLTAAVTKGLVHDGDIYYVKGSNILAVYETGESAQNGTTAGWVQINAPTGISSFSNTISKTGTAVDITHTITTQQAGNAPTSIVTLVEGNNVTLTPGTSTGHEHDITIAAIDTTYAAGTAASSSTNGASIGLKKNGGSTLDSTVTITGTNDVAVTSNANGAITVKGPNFTNKGVTASPISSDNGFQFGLSYTAGNGTDKTIYHSTSSSIDPIVKYGTNDTINGTAFTQQQSHFYEGAATLNVYTQAETDAKINELVESRVSTFNAMEYKGTINQAGLSALTTANTAHNGDTYKASAASNSTGVGGKTWSKGDLIIIKGTEVNGTVPSANFDFDIIPSGDEPYIAALNVVSTDGSGDTDLGLVDSKNGNSTIANVTVRGSTKILVKSSREGTTTEEQKKRTLLEIEHKTLTPTITTNSSLTTSGTALGDTADGIGSGTVDLFLMKNSSGIGLDSYGHVSTLTGKAIQFRHNRLKSFGTTYSDVTLGSNSTLLSKSEANLTAADTYATKATSISFESSTLIIASNGAQADADKALAIDITWGSF